MTKYIAFLRGINAGFKIKMTDLKKLFEDLGFENVRTVLATGNVLFETNSKNVSLLEEQIEKAIGKKYGYNSKAFVRTEEELEKLIKADPFKKVKVTPATVPQVTYFKGVAEKEKYPVKGKGFVILGVVDQAVCSVIDLTGASTVDLMAVLDKQFNKQTTTRNWRTLGKIYNATKPQ